MTTGSSRRDHLDDVLSALLDGELTRSEEDAARAHLRACQACGDELLAVQQARTWVRDLPPVDAPSGFYERLLRYG
ncbi:MAG: anti-sigma factor, partial [Actinomycetota bacterium]|nr:anti-sigma factor [Actinomycetota bacterium]